MDGTRDIYKAQFRLSICLSVCPFATFSHCVETTKLIVEAREE